MSIQMDKFLHEKEYQVCQKLYIYAFKKKA